MNQLQVTATFPNIAPADLDQFKQLSGEALELAKAEAGTIQYDWFFSADETKCLVRETYENSDAVLAHMGNLGDLLGQLAQLGGGLEVEVFGTPSGELIDAAAAMQPTIYVPFQRK
jgi:quinol monooxygenase YgiN